MASAGSEGRGSGGGKKVGVIGGGAAGVCAARHCVAAPGGQGVTGPPNHVVVFEQTDQLGGTWVYTEQTGIDPRTQLPVHSSMYKNLRTNLPKEVMGFPDYQIPEQERSYISSQDILRFINDYADNFDVRKHVKFNHHVTNVRPKHGGGWLLEARDLVNNKIRTYQFDAIMICNGHYHTPLWPNIHGIETFTGIQQHSHDFRFSGPYRDKTVVVVGGGPSGNDIALDISSTAKQVLLSHHIKEGILTKFPPNVRLKPDIERIKLKTVHFSDGTICPDVDVLLYCTGYKYSFPFLSDDCGITVEENCVQPLFKHFININHPTMCFIGLPFYVCAFTMFDLQVRAFLCYLNGDVILPSKELMLLDTRDEMRIRAEKGLKKKQFHMMGEDQGPYYDDLAKLGNFDPVPSVLAKLHNESSRRFLEDLVNYRNDIYRIVDKNNYIQIK
ncbi:hypothetical protein LSTR_LSTR003353 [Laodelphax striatellus]|uniref:Flavin-containing monooxygenase n=1 Tax=Laodelphax striatellus TaxID=195883 RepID=A0A482X537_LAOST|nr:hypothetical protein LSTR_LSTR003353 [Laodelphax striatellus]